MEREAVKHGLERLCGRLFYPSPDDFTHQGESTVLNVLIYVLSSYVLLNQMSLKLQPNLLFYSLLWGECWCLVG